MFNKIIASCPNWYSDLSSLLQIAEPKEQKLDGEYLHVPYLMITVATRTMCYES